MNISRLKLISAVILLALAGAVMASDGQADAASYDEVSLFYDGSVYELTYASDVDGATAIINTDKGAYRGTFDGDFAECELVSEPEPGFPVGISSEGLVGIAAITIVGDDGLIAEYHPDPGEYLLMDVIVGIVYEGGEPATGGEVYVSSGYGYTLPEPEVTTGFMGWLVDGRMMSPGDVIDVARSTTVRAVYDQSSVVTGIISAIPDRDEYQVGDRPSFILVVSHGDGTTSTVTSGYTCDPATISSAGITSVTVTYEGFSITVQVTAVEAEEDTFTVTWVVDGESTRETYAYGEMPEYPGGTPEKAPDAQYTYEFSGWDPEISAVVRDVTYTAQFDRTINTYTVTWADWDGTVLETDTNVPYGTVPSYEGAIPSRDPTPQSSYVFAGWELSDGQRFEGQTVTGDTTLTAVYREAFVIGGHTIELDCGPGGDANLVLDGDSAVLTITSDSGYVLEDVGIIPSEAAVLTLVSEEDGTVTYRISGVTADITVSVTFVQDAPEPTEEDGGFPVIVVVIIVIVLVAIIAVILLRKRL